MACADLDTKIKAAAANVRQSDAFQNKLEELFGKN